MSKYYMRPINIINLTVLLLFSVYLTLSVVFAYERILCIDNSFSFYKIVNTNSFWLPEHRIGIFLSQIPLRIGVYLGLDLSSLIIIYSLSFILEYSLIAFICHKVLKVKEAAFIIILSLIIGVSHSFFHPVTETYHALVIITLLYSLLVSSLSQKIAPIFYYTLLFITSLWALVSHPISIFAIGFIIPFTFHLKKINLKTAAYLLLLPLTTALLRVIFSDPSSYDTQQYATLFTHLKDILHPHQLYPFEFISQRLNSTYLPVIILLLSLTIYLLYFKRYLELGLVILGSAVYSIFGILTFANGDADIMMEKTFLPGIYMIIVSFCYNVTTQHKPLLNYVLLACAVFSCAFSFRNITQTAKQYTQRIETLTSILATQSSPKTIANYSDFNSDKIKLNHWNTSIDALIIAKCKLGSSKTIFLTDDKISYSYDTNDSNLFLGPTWWPIWNTNAMDSSYFYLPKTTYVRLSSSSN